MSARLTAEQALERLKQGNRRFVDGNGGSQHYAGPPSCADSTKQQEPIAIILGCSDSRVPAELVFDQGFGDLFVTRVAGNVAAPSQIGSAEFAATALGTPLIVVLGHTECGAVMAAIEAIRNGNDGLSDNLLWILDRIRPAIEGLLTNDDSNDAHALMDQAVKANIRVTIAQLERDSELIRNLVVAGDLMIVGAEYDLATGRVDFLKQEQQTEQRS